MKNIQNQKSRKEHFVGPLPSEKCKTRYVWLNVLPDDLWLEVCQGETVFKALQNTDIKLNGECGGLGKCGKCKIKVLSSIGPPSKVERELLDEKELAKGIRLACRTEVNHDLVISTEEAANGAEYFQILKTGHRPLVHIEPLVNKRLVTLSPKAQEEGLSDLDQIKLAMGYGYQDLKAPLYCLRMLPKVLKRTKSRGTAVLHEHCLMAWQSWKEVNRHYGLAFDLGTSTLVGKLINLTDGREVAVASCLNSQAKYGADVISRLQYVKEYMNGLENLYNLLIKDLNQLITRLLKAGGLNQNDIFIAVAAGNTIMQHFSLKLPPLGIAEAPFPPVLTDGLIVKAADIGLELHPEALLYVMPARSGYLGGDMISVILASGASEQDDEIVLGMDFGTNGEIFLGNRKRLLTCSTAVGPALEGARISHGMIGRAGAIEGVSFENGRLLYQVIGNIKPRGICGSGLVELVAVLLQIGIIDYEGLICPPQGETAEGLNSRIIKRSGAYEFIVASAEESYDNKPIYLSQKDVRELQLAKGAIAAGVKILMDEMHIGIEDIRHVYLAGALGNYVSPYSAMRIGLIPRLDLSIVKSLGNAASMGASMVLLSKNYWQMANNLSDSIEHVELSTRLDFNQYFVEHMDFPKEGLLDIQHEEMDDVMRAIKVEDVMTRNFPTVPSTMAVEELSTMLRDTGHHGCPVLDNNGSLVGVVTLTDVENSLRSGKAELTVGDIAIQSPFVAYPDQSLYEVLGATAEDYGRIPIVDRNDRNRLVGVLRRHDIITAYRRRLAQTTKIGNNPS
ncbi:MAG: ASKHA domain-containing protein [Chloroflexota bacterium]|nr:ASKHA domain-containing protein [Chloroflexota bacterium]